MLHCLRLALACGLVATVAGFAAPLVPHFELLNHVRPATLAGFALLGLLVFVVESATSLRRAVLVCVLANLALTVLPMLWSANASSAAAPVALRVLSWNVNWDNKDLSAGTAEMRRRNADIVLLQELTLQQTPQLLAQVGDLYPHRALCDTTPRCTGAILSKVPLADVERTPLIRNPHGRIAATIAAGATRYRVASLHLQYPLAAASQAEHMTQLLGEVRADLARGLPYVIAGDFNLTPWSYLLTRFAITTGLVRHTAHRTWPIGGIFGLPVPAFPIDHVFTSPSLATRQIIIGPAAGSDHLMVYIELTGRESGS